MRKTILASAAMAALVLLCTGCAPLGVDNLKQVLEDNIQWTGNASMPYTVKSGPIIAEIRKVSKKLHPGKQFEMRVNLDITNLAPPPDKITPLCIIKIGADGGPGNNDGVSVTLNEGVGDSIVVLAGGQALSKSKLVQNNIPGADGGDASADLTPGNSGSGNLVLMFAGRGGKAAKQQMAGAKGNKGGVGGKVTMTVADGNEFILLGGAGGTGGRGGISLGVPPGKGGDGGDGGVVRISAGMANIGQAFGGPGGKGGRGGNNNGNGGDGGKGGDLAGNMGQGSNLNNGTASNPPTTGGGASGLPGKKDGAGQKGTAGAQGQMTVTIAP